MEITDKVLEFIATIMNDGRELESWAAINNPPPEIPYKIGDKVEVVRLMFADMASDVPVGSVGTIVGLVDEADAVCQSLWSVDFDTEEEWHMEEGEIKRHVPDQPALDQEGGQDE